MNWKTIEVHRVRKERKRVLGEWAGRFSAPRRAEKAGCRTMTKPGMASEEIRHFKYDHHLILASGAWFHANHINVRIWMVQITASKSAEVLCRWLTRSGSPLGRWIRKGGLSGAWDDTL